jgi:hypothetical protein
MYSTSHPVSELILNRIIPTPFFIDVSNSYFILSAFYKFFLEKTHTCVGGHYWIRVFCSFQNSTFSYFINFF